MFCLIASSPLPANEEEWKALNLKARDLFNEGKPAEAIQSAEAALELAKEKLGESHPSVAKTLNNLGVLYLTQSQFEEAESYFESALEHIRRHAGTNDIQEADVLFNQAKLFLTKKNYAEAVSALTRSIEIRENHLGKNHSELLPLLNLLGQVYQIMGLRDDAVDIQKKMESILGARS